MWKSAFGIVLICLLLGGALAQADSSVSQDTAFGGFFYQALKPLAKAKVTQVRFTYQVDGSSDEFSVTLQLSTLRRISWRPDVRNVTKVKVQPLDKDGNNVGKMVKASGQGLYVVGIVVRTMFKNGKFRNVPKWWAVLQPDAAANLVVGGSPAGFDDFYYTDHSEEVGEVKWKFFKRKNPPPADPNEDPFESNPTGASEYTEQREEGKPFEFVRHHKEDPSQPFDAAKIEVKTFHRDTGDEIDTVVVINPDPLGVWRHLWFETQPGETGATTSMILSVP